MSTQDKQSKRSKFVGKLLVAAMSGALATSVVACESSSDSAKPAETTTTTTPTATDPAKADPAAQPGAAVKTEEAAKEGGNKCSGGNGCGAAKEGEAAKEGGNKCSGGNGCGAAKEGEAAKTE